MCPGACCRIPLPNPLECVVRCFARTTLANQINKINKNCSQQNEHSAVLFRGGETSNVNIDVIDVFKASVIDVRHANIAQHWFASDMFVLGLSIGGLWCWHGWEQLIVIGLRPPPAELHLKFVYYCLPVLL